MAAIAAAAPEFTETAEEREKRRKNLIRSLVRGHNKVPKDLNEYKDHKSILYATLALVLFMTVGCVVYTVVLEWTFTDALYFTVVTLTTVGYGDLNMSEESDGMKIFQCFYMFIGVALAAASLGIVATFILDFYDSMETKLSESSDRISPLTANLLASVLAVVLLLAIGTTVMVVVGTGPDGNLEESPTFMQGLYFACVTVTTVGYGDLFFTTNGGKWFSMFYVLLGTIVIAKALGDVASIPTERRKRMLERMVLEQYGEDLSPEELLELTHNKFGYKDDDCTRAEFSLAMLHKLNKVDEKDINMCFQQFKKLDRHEDGRLDAADLDAALSELAKEEGEVVQVDA